MFGSYILDVTIGLIFIYLFLSLFCTTIMELISNMLALRAKNLENGIKALLGDPKGADLAKRFYEHPLIKGLMPPGDRKRPSYIPSRHFATALLDIVAPENSSKTLQELRDSLSRIENKDARKALLSIMDTAGADAQKLRENFEQWFNDTMDRVAGWYKRKTQIIVLIIAFLVSIILNADTFMITKELSRNETMRSMIVASAQNLTGKASNVKDSRTTGSNGQIKQTDISGHQGPPAEVPQIEQEPSLSFGAMKEEVQKLRLPLGWCSDDEKPWLTNLRCEKGNEHSFSSVFWNLNRDCSANCVNR